MKEVSNLASNFKPVAQMRYYCYNILPLVYDDSLSYLENLCKVTKKLNDIIENVNNIPQYIEKLIREYITTGEFETILKTLLGDFIVNVKYPPEGITPATGDGTADDTQTFQDCIDYAFNNSGKVVLVPDGDYLVSSITMKNGVSLVGVDRYTTRLVQKGGATSPLIGTEADSISIQNLTLDGNYETQINDIEMVSLTGSDYLIADCILTDGNKLLTLNISDSHTQISNVVFDQAGVYHLSISGDGYANITNIVTGQLSENAGVYSVVINNDFNYVENATIETSKNGITVNGNNNYFSGVINNSTNKYVDNGDNNTFNIVGAVTDINTQDVILRPTNPLTYRAPEPINRYFSGVPAQSYAKSPYKLLVDANMNSLDSSLKEVDYYAYMFSPYCNKVSNFPQGACYLGNDTFVFSYALESDDSTVYQKVSADGTIITQNQVTAYHANSLSYDGDNTIYSVNFYVTGSSGKSNVITLIDANTLAISSTLTISDLASVGIRSASYLDGNLYIMDRADNTPGFWRYNIASQQCEKLFTFPFQTWQMCYVDSYGTVWVCPARAGVIYNYDLAGNMTKTISLNPISNDYAMCIVELENIMELDNGVMAITDVGWKNTEAGRFNRHIVATMGKQLQNKSVPNNFAWDKSDYSINVRPSVTGSFQNGTSDFPYDSIDYAAKMATYGSAYTSLNLGGSTFDQWFIASNCVMEVWNGTISGACAENNAKLILNDITVNAGASSLIQNYYTLPTPACVVANRFSKILMTETLVDGESVANIVGCYQRLGSEVYANGGTFTNCAENIMVQNGGPVIAFGNYLPDTVGAAYVSGYRWEQGSTQYRMIGGEYGMRTVMLTGQTLESVGTVTFQNVDTRLPMLTIVVDNAWYTFDIGSSSAIMFPVVESSTIKAVRMSVAIAKADNTVTVTFSGKTISDSGNLASHTISIVRLY